MSPLVALSLAMLVAAVISRPAIRVKLLLLALGILTRICLALTAMLTRYGTHLLTTYRKQHDDR